MTAAAWDGGGPADRRNLKESTGIARPLSEAPAPPSPSPRELLGALVHRLLHPRPIVLETRRPVEVPVLTETKRRWARGDRVGAIQYAYSGALADVERAFDVRFPPDWTHEDILIRGVSPEMGSVPDFLVDLLRVYEPVRYGGAAPGAGESPVPILQSIYAHPKMWGLYLAAVPAPASGASSAPTAPSAPAPEGA